MAEKRRDKGDGSIYFRESDKRWVAKYTHTTGAKPKVLYGKTEQEVKKKLREYKKEVAKHGYQGTQKSTVKEYLDKWFREVKINELKPKSIDDLSSTINRVCQSIGDLQMASLTANDIQGMINHMVSEGYAFATIKKAYNAVNACFKLGVIKGDIIQNPCLGVRPPKGIEKKRKDIRFFIPEEIEKICAECLKKYGNDKPVYRLGHAIILLLHTGMRIGELLGLKWKDIDYENRTLKINSSVVFVINRDSNKEEDAPKYHLLHQESTKTGSGIRTVHLNPKAIDALKNIQLFNGNREYVMASSNNNIISPRNFDRMLRIVLTKCGIEPTGAHTLRHTFASMLFRNGVDVKTVSELLGHSDVSITYNIRIFI